MISWKEPTRCGGTKLKQLKTNYMEKAIFVNNDSSLNTMNDLLNDGWQTKFVVPQTVSTTGAVTNYERGKIFVVLEK